MSVKEDLLGGWEAERNWPWAGRGAQRENSLGDRDLFLSLFLIDVKEGSVGGSPRKSVNADEPGASPWRCSLDGTATARLFAVGGPGRAGDRRTDLPEQGTEAGQSLLECPRWAGLAPGG